MPKFQSRFEIDIISALSQQLIEGFDALTPGPLKKVTIAKIIAEQGVYQLFHNGTLVYVGKADNLRKRIDEHRIKIEGRRNISTDDISFKCLYVHKNWTALAPEDSLIKYHKAQVAAALCEWNGNGFGPHDPGRNREETNKPPEGFDAKYPIREDWTCKWIRAGDWKVKELLIALKENLPFLLRYQVVTHYRKGHPDYDDVIVRVPRQGMAANELLKLIAHSLPGWQATVFVSHMILYQEHRTYAYGKQL